MGIRDSFSRLKKEVKHLGSRRKPDRTEPAADGEGTDPVDLRQPEHQVVAVGGEWDGVDADGRQAYSTDRPLHPDELEPMPSSGGGDDKRGGEAGVGGSEVGQMYSHPHPDAEVVGSGPGQGGDDVSDEEEGGQFYSCSSAPSTPSSGESNGM